ncbi:YifB family Mg chelatase-like AAA ATPase [Salinispira pacifica]|uniref:MG(2+) CHELATASE FAMILY PROTEIN / ComM-related protein n=1 Tax=Salinispira pacifica TaxID=1307761 RepID=V5WFA9_9SPIO|nr:ATP-binding protein [Salinispira pacifica]AHC14325.1 MG(2+) CHELATASE FAMILY PROTEIN / ComM-related protein [Salinispira pacifica]
MEIFSFSSTGYEGKIVQVECDIQPGLPSFTIVGLPDSAVKESRERVRAALGSLGWRFPQKRILINLSPCDVKKMGSGYDFAVAMAILKTSGQIRKCFENERWLFCGELGLTGLLRSSRDDLAALLSSQAQAFHRICIPRESLERASALNITGLPLTGMENLEDALQPDSAPEGYDSDPGAEPRMVQCRAASADHIEPELFSPLLRLKLAVCAAGMHNLLLYGAPGSGKTTAVRYLSRLMPPAPGDLVREQMKIHLRNSDAQFGTTEECGNCFREPHHSSSAQGLLGGGRSLGPGEISLAHGGILLLDEAPEFHRNVLQNLREPMEQGRIRVVRAESSSMYPCVAVYAFTMNVCPCGNRGRNDALCLCSDRQLHGYWSRLGGAVYDRIELRHYFSSAGEADFSRADEILDALALPRDEQQLAARIRLARDRQLERTGKGYFNGYAGWVDIQKPENLSPEGRKVFSEMKKNGALSSRRALNLLRISLTLRDLAPESGKPGINSAQYGREVDKSHISMAKTLLEPQAFSEFL